VGGSGAAAAAASFVGSGEAGVLLKPWPGYTKPLAELSVIFLVLLSVLLALTAMLFKRCTAAATCAFG
jgi:hypothetical protein